MTNEAIEIPEMRPGPVARRPRLNSLFDIETELARLYRAGKSGAIPTSEMTRLCYVLTSLSKVMEVRTIELRLNELERTTIDQV